MLYLLISVTLQCKQLGKYLDYHSKEKPMFFCAKKGLKLCAHTHHDMILNLKRIGHVKKNRYLEQWDSQFV